MKSRRTETNERDDDRADKSDEQNIIDVEITIFDDDISRRHPNDNQRQRRPWVFHDLTFYNSFNFFNNHWKLRSRFFNKPFNARES